MKDLKIIIVAFIIFILAVFSMFFAATKNSSKRALELYRQGQYFYAGGDYHNAYYNFSKISGFSKIYEIALLKQAMCAININDKKTAYKKFKHLCMFSTDAHIAPVALYNAALINLEHKKYSHAYKKFKKLYKKYPDSDYKKAAAYQLGLMYVNKNPHVAKDYFIEYLEYAPSGRYSLNALERLDNLKFYFTDDEKYVISNAYFKNEKFSRAFFIAKELNDPRAALICAKISELRGDIKSALNYYLKTLTNCDERIDEKDIATSVSKYVELSNQDPKSACEILLKQTKKTAAYPAVLFEYASYLSKMNSIKCYENIFNKYPNSYQAAQSLWNVFLYTYENGYNAKAKALAKKYLDNYKNKNSTPAVKFWYAKILMQEGKMLQAKQEFKNLIRTEPDSYYAFIAYNILDGHQTPLNSVDYGLLADFGDFNKDDLKQIFNNDKTLVTVAMLNDNDLLKLFRLHDNFALSYIALRDGNIPYSVYLARKAFQALPDKPLHNDSRYKLSYPIVYPDVINKYSKKYAQNTYLMLALMREESTFNEFAQSSVGAAGLMQLMPSTASSLGFGDVDVNMLQNPDFNINLGIKYFATLKNMFDGDEMLAVLSYNGGPSNIKNWSKKLNSLDFDEFVEDIPYSETQNYIKRVFGSYWNYIKIYCK